MEFSTVRLVSNFENFISLTLYNIYSRASSNIISNKWLVVLEAKKSIPPNSIPISTQANLKFPRYTNWRFPGSPLLAQLPQQQKYERVLFCFVFSYVFCLCVFVFWFWRSRKEIWVGSKLYFKYEMTRMPSLQMSTIEEFLATLGNFSGINNLSKNDFVTFILNDYTNKSFNMTAENGPQNDQEAHDIMHNKREQDQNSICNLV